MEGDDQLCEPPMTRLSVFRWSRYVMFAATTVLVTKHMVSRNVGTDILAWLFIGLAWCCLCPITANLKNQEQNDIFNEFFSPVFWWVIQIEVMSNSFNGGL